MRRRAVASFALALPLAVVPLFAPAPAAAQVPAPPVHEIDPVHAGIRSTASAPYVNFESGPVRPLLISQDGATLYALNTPDHRLERYALPGVTYQGALFTGLEPVSMAFDDADPNRLFVANLLSDSVAVVDVAAFTVIAIVDVGDEPRDVAVTGGKLFVACARARKPGASADTVNGAKSAFDENVVVVADATPPFAWRRNVLVPGTRPRALAAGGGIVYVIPQDSGNRTTVLGEREAFHLGLRQPMERWTAPDQTVFQLDPPGAAAMSPLFEILEPPGTGRVLRDDERNALIDWLPQGVGDPPFVLPDHDLIAIDAASESVIGATSGLGTTLLALARHDETGELWVAGTDAHNRTRFERHVRGAAVENRVAMVAPGPGGALQQVVAFAPPFTPAPHAQPAAIAFRDGQGTDLAYVAMLGTASVVVLEAKSRAYVATIATGAIPSGLAVDEAQGRLYVLCRGDHSIHRYAIANGHQEILPARRLGYDPEPRIVAEGRAHLYDARAKSGHGNGTMSCATCHVFGHTDAVAWDLGDPLGGIGYFFPDLLTPNQHPPEPASAPGQPFVHPMKGPMVTQSMRGLAGGEPFHWRGDRPFLHTFQHAFKGLLGGSGIEPAEMQQYASFAASMTFPPNPYEPKDRVLVPPESLGFAIFGLHPSIPPTPYDASGASCVDCHQADFVNKTDFKGLSAKIVADADRPQPLSVPTLRGVYEKDFALRTGFGPNHEGSSRGLRHFFDILTLTDDEAFELLSPQQRDQVTAFVRSWDTGVAPLVGAQALLDATTVAKTAAWLDFAEARALAGDVDVTFKGRVGLLQEEVGGWFTQPDASGSWLYLWDQGGGASAIDRQTLLLLAAIGDSTFWFTCAPPGSGRRLGVDRDEDGLLDGQERAIGSSPDAPDVDQDGYDDLLELQTGGDPNVFDAFLPDSVAPVVGKHGAAMVFHQTATLHVESGEAGRLTVELGLAPGSYGLAIYQDFDRARVHDVVLRDLPAGTTIHYRVTVRDENGNAGQAVGSFTTARRHVFVADFELVELPFYPPGKGAAARVRITDHERVAARGIPVTLFWSGDIGGAAPIETVETDRDGNAWFYLGANGTWVPPPQARIDATVLLVGSLEPEHAWYIGDAGGTGTWSFWYEQSHNRANARTLLLR